MTRLTRKRNNKLYPYEYSDIDDCMQGTPIDKLGQLEDIEEELEIDLILYLKVMTKRRIYIKGKEPEWAGNGANKNAIEKYYVEKFNKSWLEVRYDKDCDLHLIKNPLECYGKTWALTKEELENNER